MALSKRAADALKRALTDRSAASEIQTAIESGANAQAASVAALGATTNLVGVDGTGSNAAPLAGTESRLDAVEAKVDAVIAALKASGQMAP